MSSFADAATIELTKLLRPLRRLRTAPGATALLRELGFEIEVESGLGELADAVDMLIKKELNLAGADDSRRGEIVAELAEQSLQIVAQLQDDIAEIANTLDSSEGDPEDLATTMLQRLADFLLYEYLVVYRPPWFGALQVLGLAGEVIDEDVSVRTIHWDRLELLFSDPMKLANETYGWNTDANPGKKILARMERFIRAFGLPGGRYQQPPSIQALQPPGNDPRELHELRIPLFSGGRWPEDYVEFDVNLAPVLASTTPPQKAGLAFYPYFHGDVEIEEALGSGWTLSLKGSADTSAGAGVILRAPHELEVVTDLFSTNSDDWTKVDARIELKVRKTGTEGDLVYIFGKENSTHLGFNQTGLRALIAVEGDRRELGVEFDVLGLTIRIRSEESDSFIDEILSGLDITTRSDLVLGYSTIGGVYFRGSGSLEVEVPLHRELGPVTLESFLIGVAIDGELVATLATSFNAQLGPIDAAVERVGLEIPLSFPPDRKGNLGPAQIESARFKPPSGAGLSVDGGGIAGGGFIEFDPDNERYAGMLGLTFGEIGLTAVGLITTRLPDGSADGYSMLVNIGVTFDPPIQLSMGFTLKGVGGLVGVNRSMEVEVLQESIRNRTLDSVLFPDPKTVVANADKIISDLRSVFPPADDRYVVGPMVKIGYGSPAFITADIGIFLELPDPVRVVLMGQVEALLPEPDDAVVTLHLDVLGVVDVEKRQLTFLATLYDSRVLSYPIEGDSAFLLAWGDNSRFALSLGGFHPKFDPPAPPLVFSDLKRLSISLSSGKNFQLSCRGYQALTPNSLQFGARANLFASKGDATLDGHLSFDALIYFSPFTFEATIGAGVSIRYQGQSLANVDLALKLSGPGAWRARGKATIKMLFVTVKVGFVREWGDDAAPTLAAVNPWPDFLTELAKPGNWGGAVVAPGGMVETLRERAEADNGQPIVHPAGRVEVRQKVVPVGIRLDKVNNAPVTGHDLCIIESLLEINGEQVETEPVEEAFPRGQFVELSDAERLSVPAFERMQAGVRNAARASLRAPGEVQPAPVEYESIVIDSDRVATRQESAGEIEWAIAEPVMNAQARSRAAQLGGSRARFARPGGPKVRCSDERYCVARAADLTRAELDPSIGIGNQGLTRLAADQALSAQAELDPDSRDELIVLPEYELEDAA